MDPQSSFGRGPIFSLQIELTFVRRIGQERHAVPSRPVPDFSNSQNSIEPTLKHGGGSVVFVV